MISNMLLNYIINLNYTIWKRMNYKTFKLCNLKTHFGLYKLKYVIQITLIQNIFLNMISKF